MISGLEVRVPFRNYRLGNVSWDVKTPGDRKGRAARRRGDFRVVLRGVEELCAKLGEEPANMALAWLLHADGVTAPIIGPHTLGHLDGAQRALEIRLDEAVLARLDEIFPGYKTAPEHYAW